MLGMRPKLCRDRSTGMTIIELMIVVVIIGVLAAIAAIAYNRHTRKAKANGEVARMFAELRTREEAYYSENGLYLATGAFYPTALNGDTGVAASVPNAWLPLHVTLGRAWLYCQYKVLASTGGDATGMDAMGSALFSNATPDRDWYFVEAQCDMDKDGAFATYGQRGDMDQMVSWNDGE